MIWINILIGLILLFAGRRLFWLFVACVGFASGYHYAQQIWAVHSPVLLLVLALAVGVVGAIVAILFQKAAIVIAGFAAGGYIVLILFDQFARLPSQMVWLPHIIGGVIGAIVLFLVFDWALIFLSTLTGATLIVHMMAFKPWVEIALFMALVIAGMAFQVHFRLSPSRMLSPARARSCSCSGTPIAMFRSGGKPKNYSVVNPVVCESG